jgi:hypothetical protein
MLRYPYDLFQPALDLSEFVKSGREISAAWLTKNELSFSMSQNGEKSA